MASDLIMRKPRNRKESDGLKDTNCNGCLYMSVLDRKRTLLVNGKPRPDYYEEFYCNAKGRVIDPHGVDCEGRR